MEPTQQVFLLNGNCIKSSHVVIVDDDLDILEILRYNFEREKASVTTFVSPTEAWIYIQKEIPDVVICDWMMDEMEGIDLCRLLKMDPNLKKIPFVMLSAKDHEADIVSALEVGAEDYVVKPVKIKELMARVKKIIRRQRQTKNISSNPHLEEVRPVKNNNILTYKEISMDIDKHKVYFNSVTIDLTYSEFKLLQLLISRKGRVLSRNQIIEKLNGIDYLATERSVDVQIVGLRKKISLLKDYLETVRGVGYRMKDEHS